MPVECDPEDNLDELLSGLGVHDDPLLPFRQKDRAGEVRLC